MAQSEAYHTPIPSNVIDMWLFVIRLLRRCTNSWADVEWDETVLVTNNWKEEMRHILMQYQGLAFPCWTRGFAIMITLRPDYGGKDSVQNTGKSGLTRLLAREDLI
jgi:hypothetical protein